MLFEPSNDQLYLFRRLLRMHFWAEEYIIPPNGDEEESMMDVHRMKFDINVVSDLIDHGRRYYRRAFAAVNAVSLPVWLKRPSTYVLPGERSLSLVAPPTA